MTDKENIDIRKVIVSQEDLIFIMQRLIDDLGYEFIRETKRTYKGYLDTRTLTKKEGEGSVKKLYRVHDCCSGGVEYVSAYSANEVLARVGHKYGATPPIEEVSLNTKKESK